MFWWSPMHTLSASGIILRGGLFDMYEFFKCWVCKSFLRIKHSDMQRPVPQLRFSWTIQFGNGAETTKRFKILLKTMQNMEKAGTKWKTTKHQLYERNNKKRERPLFEIREESRLDCVNDSKIFCQKSWERNVAKVTWRFQKKRTNI